MASVVQMSDLRRRDYQDKLPMLFDGINNIEVEGLDKDLGIIDAEARKLIKGFYSSEFSYQSEYVMLKNEIELTSLPEVWLKQLETGMRESLRIYMRDAIKDLLKDNQDIVEFLMETDKSKKFQEDNSNPPPTHNCQVIDTALQVLWVLRSEEAIIRSEQDPKALRSWQDEYDQIRIAIVTLMRDKIPNFKRIQLTSAIGLIFRNQEIVQNLITEGINSVNEFKWIRYLKIFWNFETEELYLKSANVSIPYRYEYIGPKERLCVSPMTDRAYTFIMNTANMMLGSSLNGPAGTGKTETCKDFGRMAGNYTVAMNCSDEMDYIYMANIFKGLCQTGAYGVFDEFNRICIEVLSVVATQVQQIQQARIQDKRRFDFVGNEIDLVPSVNFFVTMNPGYAGRTEMPDNLKSQFRPFLMLIPDRMLICQVKLGSGGFVDSSRLGKYLHQIYQLCETQLTKQAFYDFGLRNILSVLRTCARIKQENPQMDEDSILKKVIIDINFLRFVQQDVQVFKDIMRDFFPQTSFESDAGALGLELQKTFEQKHLARNDQQIEKIVQLFEVKQVRHSIMLVGPAGSGKTTCYEVLADLMTQKREMGIEDQTFQKIKIRHLNPKTVTGAQMYGAVNKKSGEWKSGLFTEIFKEQHSRSYRQQGDNHNLWIVLDGPIDAIWVENLNTVMDDNKLLTTANSERIPLNQGTILLFEVENLNNASPATVSRAGIVVISDELLSWRHTFQAWIENLKIDDQDISESIKPWLQTTCQQAIGIGLDFLKKNCTELFWSPISDLKKVSQICDLVEGFIKNQNILKTIQIQPNQKQLEILKNCFVWSFAWGLGGSIMVSDQVKFDQIIRDNFQLAIPQKEQTIYEYWVDFESNQFKPWTDKVKQFAFDKDSSAQQIFIETQDTVKYGFHVEHLTSIQKSLLLAGAPGYGKTSIMNHGLNSLKEQIRAVNISISSKTQPSDIQFKIRESTVKISNTVLGAEPGKKIVLFVDDINMANVNTWGDQITLETIRHFMEKHGMYFFEDNYWQWKLIKDTTVVASYFRQPGGGVGEINSRLKNKFNIFYIHESSHEVLSTILSAILGGFLSKQFSQQIQNLNGQIISSTIELFKQVRNDFIPTPKKFHYTFDLKDALKLINGICFVNPQSIRSAQSFLNLWVHESSRVFQDKMISLEDQKRFKELALNLVQKNFNSLNLDHQVFNNLRFGDLLNDKNCYEQIVDHEKLKNSLYKSLEQHNKSRSSQMNLVLFEDAIDHILRICRLLNQPNSHLLLVGVGGSGRQSLTRLSTYIRGMAFEQIDSDQGSNIESFNEQLKQLIKSSGLYGKSTCFVLNDGQIVDQEIFAILSELISTGEAPELLKHEDIEEIKSGLAAQLKDDISDSQRTVMELFKDRVQANLHICLNFSPVGDKLRNVSRDFPQIKSQCSIDWFLRWPDEALLQISQESFKDLEDVSSQQIDNLCKMSTLILESSVTASESFLRKNKRHVHVTPKSYLDFLSLYKRMLSEKRNEMLLDKNGLDKGIDKLNECKQAIDELKKNIAQSKVELAEQNKVANQLLFTMQKAQWDIDKSLKEVNQKKKELDQIQSKSLQQKIEIEGEMAKAAKEVENSKVALSQLDKDSIIEIISYDQPPAGVRFVLECVMILLEEPKDWANVRKNLMDVKGFFKRLTKYDAEKTSEATWNRAIHGYISKPNFDPSKIRKISLAAYALSVWAVSCQNVRDALIIASTKKQEGDKLDEENQKIAKSVERMNQDVAAIQSKKDELNQNLNELKGKIANTQSEMDQANEKRLKAQKLIELLHEEGIRWVDSAKQISSQIDKLVGNIFVSSACLVFFGPFSDEFRESLVDQWVRGCQEKSLPIDQDYNLVSQIAEPAIINKWNVHGLPKDQDSLEDGILTMYAPRFPLCIDPQKQALNWIKKMHQKDGVLININDKQRNNKVEMAYLENHILLIEGLEEEIDPFFDTILGKQTKMNELGKLEIKLGDKNFVFNPDFKLFMFTTLSNPHYSPEVQMKITLVDYSISLQLLLQQLLADVVTAEKPEIEQQRDKLIKETVADKETLVMLEEKILKLLSEAEGSILDDENVLNTLEDSKKTSQEINQRIEKSKVVESKIDETRSLYKPVAELGSGLYFVLADLEQINFMYKLSFDFLRNLFNKSIQESPRAEDVSQRNRNIEQTFIKNIYEKTCRGLFERDKLTFSFMIYSKVQLVKKNIEPEIWNIFLRGPSLLSPKEKQTLPLNPDPNSISQQQWESIYSLDIKMGEKFEGITKQISEKYSEWQKWMSSENPFTISLPNKDYESLSNFDKLVLIKSLRPELLKQSIFSCIAKEMGEFYSVSPTITSEGILGDLRKNIPLLLVLSPGVNPLMMIREKFAVQMNIDTSTNLKSISLGQGQEKNAKNLIETGQKEGHWVVIENCHYGLTFLKELNNKLGDFNSDDVHENFRLFLTTDPSDRIPINLLHSCVNLTVELPRGIKENLRRTWHFLSQDQIDDCKKPQIWKKLLFSMSILHAIILERSKFGTQGWTNKYPFSFQELHNSNAMLKSMLESTDQIDEGSFKFVSGIIEISYGSQITNDFDKLLLQTLAQKICGFESLKDGFNYTESGEYYNPPEGDIQSYRDYIGSLPEIDPPELFQMHSNANIVFLKAESNRLMQSILGPGQQSASSSGQSDDEISQQRCLEILGSVPDSIDKNQVTGKQTADNQDAALSPLQLICIMEIDKFNLIQNTVKSSLQNLSKALKGFMLITSALESVQQSILNNQVPDEWKKVSKQYWTIISGITRFLEDLNARRDMIQGWIEDKNPKSFWLPGLLAPESFHVAILQTYARKHKILLEKVSLSFTVLTQEEVEEVDKAPDEGVYVHGLFIDGARWDREARSIVDQLPSKLIEKMPLIHLKPVENYQQDSNDYQAPFYKDTDRKSQQFSVPFAIPSNVSPSLWIQRGVAILGSLD